ncbi:Putative protein of unknown function [Podospora comata]|uniref:F-box domain-containing protein n=1 Tax=Podospora comata TaxID=48703 RepID=A0ABY6RYB6_PODCO|nr:Putative protein of unknown function [Podospora comata]
MTTNSATTTTTSLINADITLLIAEQTDLPTLLALASTNKHLNGLINTHEHSIIKSKITTAIPNPLLQPPLGSVLSSHSSSTRQILPPWSFQVAAELERRHARTEAMFNISTVPPTPLISAMFRVPSFAALPRQQFTQLVDLFKRACCLADHICDLALLVKIPAMARELSAVDPYVVQKAIHRTRQGFIKGLEPLDLALLTHLAALGGMAYAEEMGELMSSDPEGLERMVAFKETILREGSAALWGFLHPKEGEVIEGNGPPSLPPRARGSGLGRYIAGKVEGVLRDLHAYEMGLKERDHEEAEGEGEGEWADKGICMLSEMGLKERDHEEAEGEGEGEWADKEGVREGGWEGDDDDDPFVVLHGLHQTVMGAFPKPVEEPKDDEGDAVVEDESEQWEGEGVEYEEVDIEGEDVNSEEEGEIEEGEIEEEEEVFPVEPREQLILEVVRSAVPCSV